MSGSRILKETPAAGSAGKLRIQRGVPTRLIAVHPLLSDAPAPCFNASIMLPASHRLLFAAAASAGILIPSLGLADPDSLPGSPEEAFTASGLVSGTLFPGSEESVLFAALGDYGVSGAILSGISGMIRGWNPDFIISTGDNNYGLLDVTADNDPEAPGFQNAWEFNVGSYFGGYLLGRQDGSFPLQTSPSQRFFPTVGNHDSAPDAGNGGTIHDYLAYFHDNPGGSPRLPSDRGAVHLPDVSYYAFRRGPLDVFVLDGDLPARPDLIAAQKIWFSNAVRQSDARWKIAVFHQPPLTSGQRGAADWMLWDELRAVDAILCGHDHFYERLDYFGIPLFITGAGGQFLYSFRNPPDSRSLLRYNAHHSAMRITATPTALRLENRAFELPAAQESLVESFVLGNPAPIDNADDYTFFAEAGEFMELHTATPSPLGQPPLSPLLSLHAPDGTPAPGEITLLDDRRNQLLRHTSSQSGRWKVRVSALPPGRGAYTLRLRLVSPLPDYPQWVAQLPPDQQNPELDPDKDGFSNLMEYALQTDPARPPAAGAPACLWMDFQPENRTVTATFDLPSPLPPGVSYQLETAAAPGGPWQPAAWRAHGADWQGMPGATVLTGAPLPATRRTAVTMKATALRRFFRLAAVRNF